MKCHRILNDCMRRKKQVRIGKKYSQRVFGMCLTRSVLNWFSATKSVMEFDFFLNCNDLKSLFYLIVKFKTLLKTQEDCAIGVIWNCKADFARYQHANTPTHRRCISAKCKCSERVTNNNSYTLVSNYTFIRIWSRTYKILINLKQQTFLYKVVAMCCSAHAKASLCVTHSVCV